MVNGLVVDCLAGVCAGQLCVVVLPALQDLEEEWECVMGCCGLVLLSPLELVSGLVPPLELAESCPPLDLMAPGLQFVLVGCAFWFQLVGLWFVTLLGCGPICCRTYPLVQLCNLLEHS